MMRPAKDCNLNTFLHGTNNQPSSLPQTRGNSKQSYFYSVQAYTLGTMLFWSSMFQLDWTSDSHQRFTNLDSTDEGNPSDVRVLGQISHSAHGSLHSVEGRPVLEPVDLLGVEGVVQHNRVRAAVSVCQHTIQGLEN